MNEQPVFSNSDGRTVIGFAKTVKQAERLLRKQLTIHPAMKLQVWERTELSREINQLPRGFVYAISYAYK